MCCPVRFCLAVLPCCRHLVSCLRCILVFPGAICPDALGADAFGPDFCCVRSRHRDKVCASMVMQGKTCAGFHMLSHGTDMGPSDPEFLLQFHVAGACAPAVCALDFACSNVIFCGSLLVLGMLTLLGFFVLSVESSPFCI